MTVAAVKKCILHIRQDASLRDRLNSAADAVACKAILVDAGFEFSDDEFEEGYSRLLADSGTPEATAELREFRQWWQLLMM